MTRFRTARLAWALGALTVGLAAYGLMQSLSTPGAALTPPAIVDQALNAGLAALCGVIGALIVARQPRNTIGWLLMTIALSIGVLSALLGYLGQFVTGTAEPTPANLLVAWLNSWTWWLLIGPLLLIPLLFPSGRPPSPRWRWVIVSLGMTFVIFWVIATFGQTLQSADGSAVFANPVGWLPDTLLAVILVPWEGLLLVNVVLCVAALFVRFRRAGPVERQQIKWLLLTSGAFLVIYPMGLFIKTDGTSYFSVVLDLGTLALPIAIGIAILRYRLWDIDVIIQRTLVYAVLTGLLALTYFGSVLVLQNLVGALTGQSESTLVTVISTLLIAGLFVPLRRQVQAVIDRRLYRRKYDAARTLAIFSAGLRDSVDLDALSAQLLSTVDETMQPAAVSLWLAGDRRQG